MFRLILVEKEMRNWIKDPEHKKSPQKEGFLLLIRDLERIRTSDLQNRNLTFYPAELLGQKRLQR